jgi:hypothetical protein
MKPNSMVRASGAIIVYSDSSRNVLTCLQHQEWDSVPANLLTQARWFSYVAFAATKWVLSRALNAPKTNDQGASNEN